jgi:hypothetical protein
VKTDILLDSRLSNSTCVTLYGILHNGFTHGDKGSMVCSRKRLTLIKSKLVKAKKEVEAIGGELTFCPRGKQYIDVHFYIP